MTDAKKEGLIDKVKGKIREAEEEHLIHDLEKDANKLKELKGKDALQDAKDTFK